MRILAKPFLLALTAIFPVMISACYGAPMEPGDASPMDAIRDAARDAVVDAERPAVTADAAPGDAVAGDAEADAR